MLYLVGIIRRDGGTKGPIVGFCVPEFLNKGLAICPYNVAADSLS